MATSPVSNREGHRSSTSNTERFPLPETLSPCFNVRRSCAMLMKNELVSGFAVSKVETDYLSSVERRSVDINTEKLNALAQTIAAAVSSSSSPAFIEWDEHEWHYTASSDICRTHFTPEEREERVALYILTLDALNFCFWPAPGLEYEHLATALKLIAQQDEQELVLNNSSLLSTAGNWNSQNYALSPVNLSTITSEKLHQMLKPHLPAGVDTLPNLDERCRLCNEVGTGLLYHFNGSVLAMIQQAQQSAERLVQIIVNTFSGFRDTVIDDVGRQVFFYKRAQILVGDLWASLGNSTAYCNFYDIDRLTMFADYRVPQLLRHEGVLVYSSTLANKVDRGQILVAGCMDELYIRAATVVAVEQMVQVIKDIFAPNSSEHKDRNVATSPDYWCAIKLDWHLWQVGEKLNQEGSLSKHHLVRTIFY